MNDYDLMKLSDNDEEDAPDFDDLPKIENANVSPDDFKTKYKEFYSDIKTGIKEDW